MLPVIPFEILLPLAVGTGLATFALVLGILVRRLVIEWYDRGGLRQVEESERMLVEAAAGDRDDADVRDWLRRGGTGRIESFLAAALRMREREGFDPWLHRSGVGEALAQHVRPQRVDSALHRWRRNRRRWTRIAAAEALGRLGLHEGLASLAEAMDDPDTEVGYAAAEALGRHDSVEAAAAIFGRIGSHDRINDARLATILEAMSCEMTDLLREALGSEDPSVLFWAVTLIGRRKAYELVEDVRAHLHSADPNVRAAAAECVGALGVPLTDFWLADQLGDEAWFVRSHAARSLGKLGAAWAVEPLSEMLSSSHWWIRASSVDALVEIGATCWEAVEAVLGSEDQFARNSAVEVLARTAWTGPTVTRAATGSLQAQELLMSFGDSGGLGYLENALFTVDHATVPFLLDLLAEIGDDATYGRLQAARETYPEHLNGRAGALALQFRRS